MFSQNTDWEGAATATKTWTTRIHYSPVQFSRTETNSVAVTTSSWAIFKMTFIFRESNNVEDGERVDWTKEVHSKQTLSLRHKWKVPKKSYWKEEDNGVPREDKQDFSTIYREKYRLHSPPCKTKGISRSMKMIFFRNSWGWHPTVQSNKVCICTIFLSLTVQAIEHDM